MKNNKGFTLIELLATLAILSIIMVMAVPNVIGIVRRNKNKTYVEDAKKIVSLAEYKVRSSPDYRPVNGQSYCFHLNFLGATELEKAPDGGEYYNDYSYVKVINSGNEYRYEVQLVEKKESRYTGVVYTSSTNLFKDNYSTLIKSGGFSNCSSNRSFKS